MGNECTIATIAAAAAKLFFSSQTRTVKAGFVVRSGARDLATSLVCLFLTGER
jgi:hypothetical protein